MSVKTKQDSDKESKISKKQQEASTQEASPKEDISKEKISPKKTKFDWESSKSNLYSDSEREELIKEYDATVPEIENTQVIDGKVVRVSSREVVVDINFKSDGVISSSEFKYNKELKEGDTVEVLIENQEDKNGQLILSHKKARVLRAWEKLNVALVDSTVVNGKIRSRTKGGMIVDVFGIECFLPGSQIDVKPIRDYDSYVGKEMEFKVVKVNEAFRNVVVSHKALIEADLVLQTKEIMSKLEKGQVLEGTVKNITSYGVFVDLGGIDGLIHITDLSWGRISHPEEIVSLDETINVVILDFDEDKSRIQLGLKQLGEHPWLSLDDKLDIGSIIEGKVVVVADYGVFVEIQAGIEALLHVSEMSWSTHLRSAGDFFKVGDKVNAQVLTLDREQRKMSLGIKQMQKDPWEDIQKKFPVDSKHKVRVRNFTNFGIFVELQEGVDGLIHISDLCWHKKIKHPAEFTKLDNEIDIIVLDIDQENRKISLGHKQLQDNPWDVFSTLFVEGKDYPGEVKEMYDKGSLVELGNGAEGFCPKKYLLKEDGVTAQVGENLDFRVLEFSKENRKILLSHTSIFSSKIKKTKKKGKEETDKLVNKIQKQQTKSTLGDFDDLASLKDDLSED
ncbi:MAG: 30S ribosomal protein S1 [Bacteroidota bacterium]|nr:30S ribosomal protein S1 [Bacteroidota bacterium]